MTLIPDLQRDLVDAAARRNDRRRRFAVWLRLAPAAVVAAALIGVVMLPLGDDGSDRAASSQPAGSPQKPSPEPLPERSPKPPPRRGPQPIAGSLSRPVGFDFAGVSYSIVGFRGRSASRDGESCTRLVERARDRSRRLVGASCAGDRLLRRELDDHPARTVGVGGAQPTQISGFARADVARIAVLESEYPSRVVLSEPWSPEPWQDQPIRFFVVLIDTPRDRAPDSPFKNSPRSPRLEARLTSGELVDVVP
jgi:hypothetical protein